MKVDELLQTQKTLQQVGFFPPRVFDIVHDCIMIIDPFSLGVSGHKLITFN
jgi:hypothetical protein